MIPELCIERGNGGIYPLARVARRTSWGKLILWLIIVGAFNLAGLLTYLGLNHTPGNKMPDLWQKTPVLELPTAFAAAAPCQSPSESQPT